jgi:hypothetical protein
VMIKRPFFAIFFLFGFAISANAASFQSLFAPDADLWARWTTHDENSTTAIDHAPWSAFLAQYRHLGTDNIARVSYGTVTAESREALDAYLGSLSTLEISSYSRDQQFAFWINLYNALTIRVVLDAYPVESIQDIDISPGFFSDGPWDAALLAIEGEEITLNDIEHRILRPIWNDPRVHYVLNCASLGCPDLSANAFQPSEIGPILDDAARAYINSPRGAQVNEGALIASRIYDWFHEDFGSGEEEIIAHLRQYAEPDLAEALMASDSIDRYEYDWSLNDPN